MTTYTCPVCGFAGLEEPPERFSICPSCGTEFENHDYDVSHAELRRQWIAGGAEWWSNYDPTPENWSPVEQLKNIGYVATAHDRIFIETSVQSFSGKIDFRPSARPRFSVLGYSNLGTFSAAIKTLTISEQKLPRHLHFKTQSA